MHALHLGILSTPSPFGKRLFTLRSCLAQVCLLWPPCFKYGADLALTSPLPTTGARICHNEAVPLHGLWNRNAEVINWI